MCQLPLKMADEIDFENGRISNFQSYVTLTLDRAIAYRRASLIEFYLCTKFC